MVMASGAAALKGLRSGRVAESPVPMTMPVRPDTIVVETNPPVPNNSTYMSMTIHDLASASPAQIAACAGSGSCADPSDRGYLTQLREGTPEIDL